MKNNNVRSCIKQNDNYLRVIFYSFLLFLIVSQSSCKSPDNNLYVFDLNSLVENQLTLSDIADDVIYIPFDNSFPIGLYQNIRITGNSIYMSVKDVGVLVFNRDGKNPRVIGSLGRGPGEYAYSYNFDVDNKNGTVYLIDGANSNQIKVYSKDGTFIKDISLPEYMDGGFGIDFYNDTFFLSKGPSRGKAKFNWIVLDTLGNLLGQKENSIPPFETSSGGLSGTYKYKERIFYFNGFNDTIFSILPDLSYEASFLIGQGNYRLPRYRYSFVELPDYLSIKFIFETSHLRVLRYYYKSNSIFTMAIVDKDSEKSYLINPRVSKQANSGVEYEGGILNDLDGGVMFQPEGYFEENGKENMFELLPPHILKSYVSSSTFKNSKPSFPEKKSELEKLAASLKETDNPVLIMVRLKQ